MSPLSPLSPLSLNPIMLRFGAVSALCFVLLCLTPASQSEVVEEIVAWVNGEIITKSDLDREEQAMISEAYRRYTGEELDQRVEMIRETLLIELINNKILLSHAQMVYDLDKLREAFYSEFRRQQGVESDEEFERMLARDGLTVDSLKDRLVEMFAPDEVKRLEVGSRISVAEREVRQYYDQHTGEFVRPGEVTLRELVILADTGAKKESRRADAEQALARARSEDFASVVKEISEAGTKADGGLLGPLQRGDLSARLEEVAYSIPVGSVSELIEAPYGFHILKIESRVDDEVASYDEVHDQLLSYLEDQKYISELQEFLKNAREEAEWCVKPAYRARLTVDSPECSSL